MKVSCMGCRKHSHQHRFDRATQLNVVRYVQETGVKDSVCCPQCSLLAAVHLLLLLLIFSSASWNGRNHAIM